MGLRALTCEPRAANFFLGLEEGMPSFIRKSVLLSAAIAAVCAEEKKSWEQAMCLAADLQRQGEHAQAAKVLESTLGGTGTGGGWRAVVLNRLGALYQDMGDYREAERFYLRSITALDQSGGEGYPSKASPLNNLGTLYIATHQYGRAERTLRRALELRESEPNPGHPGTAVILNNLGAALYGRREYQAAEEIYRRALAIAERKLGPDHRLVGQCLAHYALLLRETKRKKAAKRMEQRARLILAALPPDDYSRHTVHVTELGGQKGASVSSR